MDTEVPALGLTMGSLQQQEGSLWNTFKGSGGQQDTCPTAVSWEKYHPSSDMLVSISGGFHCSFIENSGRVETQSHSLN